MPFGVGFPKGKASFLARFPKGGAVFDRISMGVKKVCLYFIGTVGFPRGILSRGCRNSEGVKKISIGNPRG